MLFQMRHQLNRREFVRAAGVLTGAALAGCSAPAIYRAVDEKSFPCYEVAGSPYEIGLGAGKRFGGNIRTGLERRADWFSRLRSFAMGSGGRTAYETFVVAAERQAPRQLAELRGWADGAEIPFDDLMVLNLKAELDALLDHEGEESPGCSTVVMARPGESVLHLQNEDGHEAYHDLMFLLRVRPDDGASFLSLTYPGILPGNGPVVNERGIVQTTNFIASRDVRIGVGRYFLSRSACEAKTLEDAVERVSLPTRAFGFHHVFTDIDERRTVAVELSPVKRNVRQVDGLLFHTNHLLYDGMTGEPQDQAYVNSSSLSRWNVIRRWAEQVDDPSTLTRDDILVPLGSHEGKPYSPCRHPEGNVRGYTLGTVVFEAPSETFRLSRGQSCLGRWNELSIR